MGLPEIPDTLAFGFVGRVNPVNRAIERGTNVQSAPKSKINSKGWKIPLANLTCTLRPGKNNRPKCGSVICGQGILIDGNYALRNVMFYYKAFVPDTIFDKRLIY